MASNSSGDFNHIADAIKALHEGLAQAVAETARAVRDEAKTHAAVDTGYMRDHIYAVTSEGSDYDGGGDKSLPAVEKPASDLEAVAASAATYSVYVELGTSRAVAQPFMLPAAESVRGKLPGVAAQHISIAFERRLGK